MATRRRAIALSSLAAFICSVTIAAQSQPAPRKLTKAEEKERDAIYALVTGVAAGQPAPNDLSLTWLRDDMLKASGNQQYIPFIVGIDPSKSQAKNLMM